MDVDAAECYKGITILLLWRAINYNTINNK